MTSVEDVGTSEYVGSPVDRLIKALSADPGLWQRVSVSFNDVGGMQVNMHNGRWSAVVEMTVLLGLDSQPDEFHRLQDGASTIVVGFAFGQHLDGGTSLVWFVNENYAAETFGADHLGRVSG